MKSGILLYFSIFFLLKSPFIAGAQEVNIELENGYYMQIQACSNEIFRVRYSAENNFPQTLMERYGILKTDWDKVNVNTKTENSTFILETDGYSLFVDRKTGAFSVKDKNNRIVLNKIGLSAANTSKGIELGKSLNNYFEKANTSQSVIGSNHKSKNKYKEVGNPADNSFAEILLKDDERFYGGGSSSRTTIQHRGTALRMWAAYQRSEYVIPFVVSSDGWGVLNNVTERNYFDIGRYEDDKFYIYNTTDKIDFYIMLAGNMPRVIDLYTEITGKPYLLPKWAYGLAFGSNTMEDQFDVLNNAKRFRDEKIPCDIYWLEPQWMAKNYDYSTKKYWDLSKFKVNYSWLPDPKDNKYSNLFLERMYDLGYKVALWLCIDHDLTIEEEDRVASETGGELSGKEHWFPHLNKFTDQGICGYKLDPGQTQMEHPKRKYYNKKTDKEMHNLNQVLLQKQMNLSFRKHTGNRSFHHYCGGYSGSQHWGASTVGDNGGGEKTLYDILNHSFSGSSNMSIDVLEDVRYKAPAIHYSFFTPWVQLNSWAWVLHPWFFNESDENMFRFYAQLRYSLIPYIYSAALNSSLNAMPIVRPMPLIWPDDKNMEEMLNEYMFGESFLVGAFTDSVYLPEGDWIDYWSGKKYSGNQHFKYEIPKGRGGFLFVKSGAIIPYQKPQRYIKTDFPDTLIVRFYPEGNSTYTLLEDDGISYKYEQGIVAKTVFTCEKNNKFINIEIKPDKANYSDELKNRVYELELFCEKPEKVTLESPVKKTIRWKYDPRKSRLSFLIDVKSLDSAEIKVYLD